MLNLPLLPLALARQAYPRYKWSSHQQLLQQYLMQSLMLKGAKKKLLVSMPPQHTKSTIVSEIFPAWHMGLYPDRDILVFSYKSEMAEMRGVAQRKLYNRFMAPLNGCPMVGVGTKSQWQTSAGGKVTCVGILGSATGRPATGGIIIDDPIRGEADAASPTIRDKIWHAYLADIKTRLHPDSFQVVVSTRWHEDDLHGRLLQHEPGQWDVLQMPALNEAGEGLWEDHFPRKWYLDVKKTHEDAGTGFLWDTLYQNNPVGDWTKQKWPASYFKEHIWYNELPKDLGVKMRLVVCDPSQGRQDIGKNRSDNTAILYCILDRNFHVWVEDAVIRVIPMDQIETYVAAMADKWQPDHVVVEDIGYQKMILDNVKKIYDARPNEWRPSLLNFPLDYRDKNVRILFTLSDKWAQGRIHLKRSVANLNILVSEAKQFPSGRNDDSIDCLSAAHQSFHKILKGQVK